MFWLNIVDKKILMQVAGGDPLLKLIAVDWLKVDKTADRIALHHRNLVQVKFIILEDFICKAVFEFMN